MEVRFSAVAGHAFLSLEVSLAAVALQEDNKKQHEAVMNICRMVITFSFCLTVNNILGTKKHSFGRAIKDIQIVQTVDLINLKHRHIYCYLIHLTSLIPRVKHNCTTRNINPNLAMTSDAARNETGYELYFARLRRFRRLPGTISSLT